MQTLVENPVFFTYAVTFGFLLGSTAMTLLESLYIKPAANASYSYLSSALMIETGVNIVAGYFYYTMVQMIQKSKPSVPALGLATQGIRSLDWLITTPFMLLSLMLYFMFDGECGSEDVCDSTMNGTPKQDIVRDGSAIVAADILMILLGSNLVLSWFNIGFAGAWILFLISSALFVWIVLLFKQTFYDNSKTKYKAVVSALFLGTWGFYPVFRILEIVQLLPAVVQVGYNILDLLSKGGFGILIFIITTMYNSEDFVPAKTKKSSKNVVV